VVIIADDSANPSWVARDMLAQAEHDALAQSVLITTSESLAQAVQKEIENGALPPGTPALIEESLTATARSSLWTALEEAFALSNLYAPST